MRLRVVNGQLRNYRIYRNWAINPNIEWVCSRCRKKCKPSYSIHKCPYEVIDWGWLKSKIWRVVYILFWGRGHELP